MSPAAIKAIAALFSMKGEIRLVFGTVLGICLVPILAVIILTQAGFQIISDALASGNQQTHQVDIKNPATGNVEAIIDGPFAWPAAGSVTLEFGESDLPYQPIHTGIDIAGPLGNSVTAFMKGTVTYAGSQSTGFGTHVVLDDGNNVTSTYGHMANLAVSVGQQVNAGTVLGTRGSTGWSTGPHLHFQIDIYGIPVNPRTFLEGNP